MSALRRAVALALDVALAGVAFAAVLAVLWTVEPWLRDLSRYAG